MIFNVNVKCQLDIAKVKYFLIFFWFILNVAFYFILKLHNTRWISSFTHCGVKDGILVFTLSVAIKLSG